MSTPVPASTSIRRSRVANIDTDRLLRRQAYIAGEIDGHFPSAPTRHPFVLRAQEMFAVENELDARGVDYQRRTLTRIQADAIATA